MMTPASAVVAALLLLAPPTAADRAAVELKGLPRCAAAPAAPADWKRLQARDGFSVAAPACFELAPEQPHFMHGGQEWRCGDSSVTVSWGMWAASSFDDDGQRCAATIGGLPAMVMTLPQETLVWYLTGTVHEPLVRVWSRTAAGLKALLPVVESGAVSAAPPPR